METFFTSIDKLKSHLSKEFSENPKFLFEEGDPLILTSRIEHLTLLLIKSIVNYQPQLVAELPDGTCKVLSFANEGSKAKFAIVSRLISKIFRLALVNKTSNKRELFYENIIQFRSQAEVDRALHDICLILHTPIWQLRIHATGKGLIAGTVTFKTEHESITLDPLGCEIPHNICNIQSISSPAKWILLIEKDAAFQKLIQDGGLERLGPNIFVTGKGFPDVNTRMMVRRLWDELHIPILALVDADPYGIEIMLVYRFGSLKMASHSSELACPAIRWLGVHPTDIGRFGLANEPLSGDDQVRLSNMLSRPYIANNAFLKSQIQVLLDEGVKAEMEALSSFSSTYLVDSYIPSKMICQEYI